MVTTLKLLHGSIGLINFSMVLEGRALLRSLVFLIVSLGSVSRFCSINQVFVGFPWVLWSGSCGPVFPSSLDSGQPVSCAAACWTTEELTWEQKNFKVLLHVYIQKTLLVCLNLTESFHQTPFCFSSNNWNLIKSESEVFYFEILWLNFLQVEFRFSVNLS